MWCGYIITVFVLLPPYTLGDRCETPGTSTSCLHLLLYEISAFYDDRLLNNPRFHPYTCRGCFPCISAPLAIIGPVHIIRFSLPLPPPDHTYRTAPTLLLLADAHLEISTPTKSETFFRPPISFSLFLLSAIYSSSHIVSKSALIRYVLKLSYSSRKPIFPQSTLLISSAHLNEFVRLSPVFVSSAYSCFCLLTYRSRFSSARRSFSTRL